MVPPSSLPLMTWGTGSRPNAKSAPFHSEVLYDQQHHYTSPHLRCSHLQIVRSVRTLLTAVLPAPDPCKGLCSEERACQSLSPQSVPWVKYQTIRHPWEAGLECGTRCLDLLLGLHFGSYVGQITDDEEGLPRVDTPGLVRTPSSPLLWPPITGDVAGDHASTCEDGMRIIWPALCTVYTAHEHGTSI